MATQVARSRQIIENSRKDGVSSTDPELLESTGIRGGAERIADEFAILPDVLEQCGLKPGETFVGPIRPGSHDRVPDRIQHLRRRAMELGLLGDNGHGESTVRLMVDPTTGQDPWIGMDNIPVIIPQALADHAQDIINSAQVDYAQDLKPFDAEGNIVASHTDVWDTDPDAVRRNSQRNHEWFRSLGIGSSGNSPTSGMSLDDAAEYMKRRGEDPKAIMDEARRGAHHSERDEWEAMMESTAKNSGIKFAVPAAVGKGKTLQEKVAAGRPSAAR